MTIVFIAGLGAAVVLMLVGGRSVVTQDASGDARSGWSTFGSYWSFWPTGDPEIRWDT